MFTRVRPAHWDVTLEQADLAPVGRFTHLPVTWSGVLKASFIRTGVRMFAGQIRVNPLGGVEPEDPYTEPEVVPTAVDDPGTERDDGEIDPLYPMP